MSDLQSPVRVLYRSAQLADGAPVHPAGDGVFVALAAPMPVRSKLRLVTEDGTAHGLVVDAVVEVADGSAHGVTGVIGHLVDEGELAGVVGSEHLASAEVGERPRDETTAVSDGSDGTNAAMAMPAPVVVGGGDEDDDDDAEDAHREDEGASAEEASETSDEERPRKRGRRRRGKKNT